MNSIVHYKETQTSFRPTPETYEALEYAFDSVNAALFDGHLPGCLITLQRRPKTMGYFSEGKFTGGNESRADELALNPTRLMDCSILDFLVILVHVMLHLWQAHFGEPGRGGYHNREFAVMAKKIGLYPSDTGMKGGRETGERMSHYVVADGPFHKLAVALEESGFSLSWHEVPHEKPSDHSIDGGRDGVGSKSGKRVRYVCPKPHGDESNDKLKIWGREGIEVICSCHGTLLIPG